MPAIHSTSFAARITIRVSNGNVRDFDHAELDDSYTLGIGAGYQVNNYLRADVTLDYLGNAEFEGFDQRRLRRFRGLHLA